MKTKLHIRVILSKQQSKQNLTFVVISYDIYETRQRLVSYISFEMTTRVRSSIYIKIIESERKHYSNCCEDNMA